MKSTSHLVLLVITSEWLLNIVGVSGTCEAPQGFSNTKPPEKPTYALESTLRLHCEDSFLRKAGTSNLFLCKYDSNNKTFFWRNEPKLKCIPDPSKPAPTKNVPVKPVSTTVANTQTPNLTLTTSSATVRAFCTTMENTKSTSATSGQTFTTHTVTTTTTTTGTPLQTTLRTTTKESLTTANRIAISSSTILTDRDLTTVSSQSNHSSSIRTSTEVGDNIKAPVSSATKGGIAAGTVLILIVVIASAAGLFLWCRRSRRREVSSAATEMNQRTPVSDQPLLDTSTAPNFSPSSENPTQTTDSPLLVLPQA